MDRELRQAPKRAITIILAGGRGSRLMDLTDNRAKPAVHFGGKYRIIDFALSNCVNSGFRRISVLTQYKSHSLIRHMQHGWGHFRAEMGEYVDIIPAQQRIDETLWYQGTADAVYQNLDIFDGQRADYVLILAGDHVYKMDYAALLADHIKKGADVTIPCIEVPRMEATGFGVMKVDAEDRIVDFLEKPKNPPGIPGNEDFALASMGIYIFNAKFLYDQLRRDAELTASSHDFGKDIIPYLVPKARVMAHRFSDSCVRSDETAPAYWKDVGTIDSYWEANIDMTRVTPQLDLYDSNWPIFTYQEQLPAAKFVFDDDDRRGYAVDSVISHGCIISGSKVRQSLLSSRVRVNSFCEIDEAVLLPDVVVGRYARLKKVVVDRGTQIPQGLVVGEDAEEDARRFYRSPNGVVLINSDMIKALESECESSLRPQNYIPTPKPAVLATSQQPSRPL
jgi:glucose-1-phosphate adenylyltransferase